MMPFRDYSGFIRCGEAARRIIDGGRFQCGKGGRPGTQMPRTRGGRASLRPPQPLCAMPPYLFEQDLQHAKTPEKLPVFELSGLSDVDLWTNRSRSRPHACGRPICPQTHIAATTMMDRFYLSSLPGLRPQFR